MGLQSVSSANHPNLSPEQTQHFLWLLRKWSQQKSSLLCYTVALCSSDPLCLFKRSWQPEDRALGIAHRLIYSIIQSPCRLVTCWPRDSIVSYQTSHWTAEVHVLTRVTEQLVQVFLIEFPHSITAKSWGLISLKLWNFFFKNIHILIKYKSVLFGQKYTDTIGVNGIFITFLPKSK